MRTKFSSARSPHGPGRTSRRVNGRVSRPARAMEIAEVKVERDANGRRIITPVGDTLELPCELALLAIGFGASPAQAHATLDEFLEDVKGFAASYRAPSFSRDPKNLIKLRAFFDAKLPK